jgi:hypothetical protein
MIAGSRLMTAALVCALAFSVGPLLAGISDGLAMAWCVSSLVASYSLMAAWGAWRAHLWYCRQRR